MGNINKTKFKSLLFVGILTFALMSIAFAASGSSNAKKFYTDLLKDASKRYNEVETSTFLNSEIGKISIKVLESRKFTEDSEDSPLSVYMKELFTEEESKAEQTIIFDRVLGKYYSKKLSDDSTKEYLYDANRNLIYAKQEDGSVVYCTPTSYMLSDVNSFVNNSAEESKAIAFVLDKCADNLKDSYFVEKKVNGLNEYIISMDKNQMKDFIVNVYIDLAQDDDFKDFAVKSLGASLESWSEDMNSAIQGVKERFDNMKEAKFEMSITLKGKNIKNLNGIKMLLKMDDEEFKFELVGEKGKTLLKSKEGSFVMSYGDEAVEGKVFMDDKKIGLELKSSSESSYRSSNTLVSFEIKTLDNKSFTKSSNIEMKVISSSENKYSELFSDLLSDSKSNNELTLSISTEDKKAFDKSKKIVIKMDSIQNSTLSNYDYNSDSKKSFSIEIVGNDNKEVFKSNEITISLYEEGSEDNDNKIIVKSKDNKEILKSTNVEVTFVDGTKSQLAFVIKSNDKKPIKESTDIEFLDYINPYLDGEADKYTLKAYDKKKFKDSKDVEFTYTEAGEEVPTAGIRISILDKKDLLETGKLKVSGFVDGGQFELNMESKDKKSLLQTNDFKITFNYESEDKKSYINLFMDNKSYKMKSHSESNLLGLNRVSETELEHSALKESNIGSLIDINNAKEKSQKEVSEILGVYYFDAEAYEAELQKLLDELNMYSY